MNLYNSVYNIGLQGFGSKLMCNEWGFDGNSGLFIRGFAMNLELSVWGFEED